MKRTVLVGLLALVFVLGVIVGTALRPHSVAAATGSSIQSWGLIPDPNSSANKVLVLYDSSTGEIWGYREQSTLGGTPVRIGSLTKVGAPIVK
jgi:hypothetical protein